MMTNDERMAEISVKFSMLPFTRACILGAPESGSSKANWVCLRRFPNFLNNNQHWSWRLQRTGMSPVETVQQLGMGTWRLKGVDTAMQIIRCTALLGAMQ